MMGREQPGENLPAPPPQSAKQIPVMGPRHATTYSLEFGRYSWQTTNSKRAAHMATAVRTMVVIQSCCSQSVQFHDMGMPWLWSIKVLYTSAGVWCDTKSIVTSPRTARFDASAAVGD